MKDTEERVQSVSMGVGKDFEIFSKERFS